MKYTDEDRLAVLDLGADDYHHLYEAVGALLGRGYPDDSALDELVRTLFVDLIEEGAVTIHQSTNLSVETQPLSRDDALHILNDDKYLRATEEGHSDLTPA